MNVHIGKSNVEASLRILVIANARIPVPPHGYGGAERILAELCDGFASHGHHVTLMARKGSQDYGRLVAYPWAGQGVLPWRAFCKLNFMARSARELMRNHDIVLAGCRVDYLAPFLRSGLPIAYRFGNPIQQHEVQWLMAQSTGPLDLISVSDHQRQGFIGRWHTIHNGVDVDRYSFSESPRDGYIAFLGRLTANKGTDKAIRVAQQCGIRLRIAGNISDEPGGRAFFEAHVRPHLSDRIEWIGEIGDVEKVTFLGGASALLAPIQWDEPCANVVAEALACGTPVITTPRGSMPELIRDGHNGFIVETEEQMVRIVQRIPEISRRTCRDDAELRLSSHKMVEAYLDVLRALATAPRRERLSMRAVNPS